MDPIKLNLSPRTKPDVREAINRLRNKSPQLQTILRERWKKELKEKRSFNFDQRRYTRALARIQLEDKKEEVQQASVTTQEDQLIQQYEQDLQETIDSIEYNEVLCPICQKNTLTVHYTNVSCPFCDYVLNNSKSIHEIQIALGCCVETHSENCEAKPDFTIVYEEDSSSVSSSKYATLYMMCEICSWLTCIP